MKITIYLITNIVDGKRYIGQTKRLLQTRWREHCDSRSCCRHLSSSIQEQGTENFIIEPIIVCDAQELANEFEKEYIDRYKTLAPNGYNLNTGGLRGAEITEQTRKLLSSKLMGNKNGIGNKGHTNVITTEETKEKLRKIMLGNKICLGLKKSPEEKLKIGQRVSGEKNPAAILNLEKVREIRKLYPTGLYTHKKLSVMYGVDRSLIGLILRKKVWNYPDAI